MHLFLAKQLIFIMPELLLLLGAIVFLMLGVFSEKKTTTHINGLAIALLLAAFLWLIAFHKTGEVFAGALVLDAFSIFLQVLILLGAFAALVMAVGYAQPQGLNKFEFPVLVLLATVGMMLLVCAHNCLSLYLTLELQSLAFYVLASFNRDNVRSSEAGIKYFVLGALSSVFLLYGISLLYGYTGSIDFAEIAKILSQGSQIQIGAIFALVFIFAGLAFKISAVPFHMWTPDVYEGAPTPVTAFFAGAPKFAALGVILRLSVSVFSHMPHVQGVLNPSQQVFVFLALCSMLLAAFGAIGQVNIKRLMAYSSIGQIGYALVGLAAGNIEGINALLVYCTLYFLAAVGAFAFILMMRTEKGSQESIYDLAGLSQTRPYAAVMMTAILFSLAGIPPLGGFFAKWFSFSAAVKAGLTPLAIVAVLTSVVSAFYYLRVIRIMWFDAPKFTFVPARGEWNILLAFSSGALIFYVLFAQEIFRLAQQAALSLLG